MRMGKLNVLTSVVLSSLLLSACGGGDSGSDSPAEGPVVEQAPVSARDGFNVVAPDEAGYVDLSSLIESGTAGAKVTDVYLESSQGSGQCGQVQTGDEGSDILGQGFNVTVEGAAICEYGYEVESVALAGQTKTRARAKVMVASSAGGAAVLPPISIAMAVGDPELETDIKAALGTDFPAGYTLSEDFSVLGDGEVDISTDDFTITYQATAEGVSRVVYALEGNIAGVPDIKMGTLDYAVSDNLNIAPTAESFTYAQKTELSTVYDIDVSKHISAVDSDTLQLVAVDSYTADVASKAPEDMSNHVFTFEASNYGMHYVTYTVSDQRGGFATGIAEVRIDDPDTANLWGDVENGLLLFSAPITRIEADTLGITYQDFFNDTNYYPSVDVTSYSSSGSDQYCISRGARLPTINEFKALVEAQDPAKNWNWPSDRPYTTDARPDFSLKSSSLLTGLQTNFSNPSYVTCVSSTELTTTMNKNIVVANGIDNTNITVSFERDGQAVSNAELLVEVTGNAVLSVNAVTTGVDGKANVSVNNIKSESVVVSFTYVTGQRELISSTQFIDFIGDIDTARVKKLTIIKNYSFSDGVDKNTFNAQLLDINDNPVQGALIEVSINSDNASLSEEDDSLITDTEGLVVFNVTNSVEESVLVTTAYTNLSERTSQQANVTYTQLYTFIESELNNQSMGTVGRNIVVTRVLGSKNKPVSGLDVFFSADNEFVSFINEDGVEVGDNTGVTITTNSEGEARAYLRYNKLDDDYGSSLVTGVLVNGSGYTMSQFLNWERFPTYEQIETSDPLVNCASYSLTAIDLKGFLLLFNSPYKPDTSAWGVTNASWDAVGGGRYGGQVYGRLEALDRGDGDNDILRASAVMYVTSPGTSIPGTGVVDSSRTFEDQTWDYQGSTSYSNKHLVCQSVTSG